MELKVVVPTSLSEITLDQYQRFARLEGDEEFLTHKMLEIFCGVPLAQLPNVKFASVANVMRHINTMFSEKPSLKTEFKLGEHTFGFIPNLEDITFGEYVDLDNYMSDVQDLHKTMAVLYRPITERAGRRYAIEPYESAGKYADLMKDAPMDAVMGASLFFYRLGNDLINRYPDLFGESENEYSPESQFGRKWGWYSSFYQLAQGDVTRFERVGQLGVHEALTFLVFEKERLDIERKQLDKLKK
jgi:hypothetical protein